MHIGSIYIAVFFSSRQVLPASKDEGKNIKKRCTLLLHGGGRSSCDCGEDGDSDSAAIFQYVFVFLIFMMSLRYAVFNLDGTLAELKGQFVYPQNMHII